MGLFDLFKKKKQTKVVKIEEKTPTQTSTPKISSTTTKKEIKLYPTEPFNVDYNTHWVKETLKTIPTYTKNYREGFRGIPKSLVSDEQFDEFFIEYCDEYNLLDENQEHRSKGYNVEQINKHIKSYCYELKTKKYDGNNKNWSDFDITHQFLQIRTFMINHHIEPFPSWVWNVRGIIHFNNLFRVCRDYTKWKKSSYIVRTLFGNVCNWEKGSLFRENDDLSKYEEPLWLKWNDVGKVFLSMKTIMKKDEDGLDWLKNEIGGYIKSRVDFYNQFGSESEYNISDELISKYENL